MIHTTSPHAVNDSLKQKKEDKNKQSANLIPRTIQAT